ncbi:transcriptional regulator, partial [Acetobacter malorum]
GVQPFGGRGLSGTGPKAGGPLILRRLLAQAPALPPLVRGRIPATMASWTDWLREQGESKAACTAAAFTRQTLVGGQITLPGPVGESNLYSLTRRGNILCIAQTKAGLYDQISLALSGDNAALVLADSSLTGWIASLPDALQLVIRPVTSAKEEPCAIVLGEQDDAVFAEARKALSTSDRPIASAWLTAAGLPAPESVVEEQCRSINTTAAGGNASLMALG